jgi:regulator of protease activity HflC (stomatin/prohibitin superfamily)
MINPKKLAQFLARALTIILPILAIVLVLSLATELSHRDASWGTLRRSWRFWLSLGRDMLPSIVALLAAFFLASRYVQALYGIDDLSVARWHVLHRLFGLIKFAPWLKVTEGTADGDEKHILNRLGGPGHLVVYNDSAVLLDQAGRFTRVESSKFPPLAPYERIYCVVDQRPKRRVYEVDAMSREGIPIRCEADISYQIDNDGVGATEDRPFPATKEKLFLAATRTWIREAKWPKESRSLDWSDRVVISEAAGNLRSLLARYPLDRLIGLLGPSGVNQRDELRQQLETRLRAAAPQLGARILRVELGDIRVDDEVTQQWIDAWQAFWDRRATEARAEGRARQASQLEDAKTEAQILMLRSYANALRPLLHQEQTVTSKLVLTRLFMVLSRAPSDPLTRINLPKEAINTLDMIRKLIV